MRKPLNKHVLKYVLDNSDYTKEEVEEVFRSICDFTARVLRTGLGEGVRIENWGKFWVNPKRVPYIRKIRIKKIFDEFFAQRNNTDKL